MLMLMHCIHPSPWPLTIAFYPQTVTSAPATIAFDFITVHRRIAPPYTCHLLALSDKERLHL